MPLQPSDSQSIQQKKPLIPSLKVGGLGISTLVKEGGKTQEELDVENLVKGNKNEKKVE